MTAQVDRNPQGQDRHGLGAKHESAFGNADAPTEDRMNNPTQPQDSEIEAVARIIEPRAWGSVWGFPDEIDCDADLELWRNQARAKATAAINALSMHRASLSGGGEVERLMPYLQHHPDCVLRGHWMEAAEESCDCGLAAALTIPSSPEGGR